jgi:hypothetical protein
MEKRELHAIIAKTAKRAILTHQLSNNSVNSAARVALGVLEEVIAY